MCMDNTIKSGISVQKIKDKADLKSDNHSHSYYEMVYVRSGDFTYFIEDTMVPAQNKSIILVDKNTIHKAILSTHNYTYFIVKFTEKFIEENFLPELKLLFLKKQIVLSHNQYLDFDILFSKIYHEYRDKKNHWDTLIGYYISEIITMLGRLPIEENTEHNKEVTVVEKACQYINSCITDGNYESLNLLDISKVCFLSPCHLSRKFKKEVGMGLKEYINISRIAYAKRLMEKCDCITEVAFASGFPDSNYFATIFKRVEDMTPSQYLDLIRFAK